MNGAGLQDLEVTQQQDYIIILCSTANVYVERLLDVLLIDYAHIQVFGKKSLL